jgi:hypothetical protein
MGKQMTRTLLVSVLLALAVGACATAPPRTAAGLVPLGPCPASSWRPEAPPPSASEKQSMVLLAIQEWNRFGRSVITYLPDGPPRVEHKGVLEGDDPERVRDYWRAVDKPERSGTDGIAWSAAFISWDIESSGVPRDLFCPDQQHTIYVERLVDRAKRPGAVLVPRWPGERPPQVGDLICATRDRGTTSLDNLNRGPGHCDVVVETGPGRLEAIGGNVSDSVTLSNYPLDAEGFLRPLSGHPVFTVIENRLP